MGLVKTIATGAALVTSMLATSNTVADNFTFHGTQCHTANVSQGALMSWTRTGLVNNFSSPLFVICPLPFDVDANNAFPTPRVEVRVGEHIRGDNDGATCTIRLFNARDLGGPAATADPIVVSAQTIQNINIGTTGDLDIAVSFLISEAFGIADLPSLHALCLLPPGNTITGFTVDHID